MDALNLVRGVRMPARPKLPDHGEYVAAAVRVAARLLPGAAYTIIALLTLLGGVALDLIRDDIAYAGRIFPGASVLNVDLGGATVSDADLLLEAPTKEYSEATVLVGIADVHFPMTRAELGAGADPRALAQLAHNAGRQDALLVRYLHRTWSRLAGQHQIPMLGDADRDRLLDAAARIRRYAAPRLGEPRDAKFEFTDDEVRLIAGRAGRAVDDDRMLEALLQALNDPKKLVFEIPTHVTSPDISDSELEPLRPTVEQLLLGPTRIHAGQRRLILRPSDLNDLLFVHRSSVDDSRPVVLGVRPDKASELIESMLRQVTSRGKPARINWNEGELAEIEAAAPTMTVDRSLALAELTGGILAARADIHIPVDVNPGVDALAARDLGVREHIHTARHRIGSVSNGEMAGIELALRAIHGRILLPTDSSSFDAWLDETDMDASLEPRTAEYPGVRLVATELLSALRSVGAENLHEADGALPKELQVRNTTSTPILVQTGLDESDDSMIIGLYGTKSE